MSRWTKEGTMDAEVGSERDGRVDEKKGDAVNRARRGRGVCADGARDD